jgi:mannose-6-phosphate isomerase-like protein (cupin superfamily)
MGVRLVVTGTNDAGKSVFVSDGPAEPTTVGLMPGLEFHNVWGADTPVPLPCDGRRPATATYFPPVGGFRFGLVTIPPETSARPPEGDVSRAVAEVAEKLPGMLAHMEPNAPGMHTTDTIDFEVLLSGEMFLELDDGAEVHLKAGDCVIQNGTRHAWHNRGREPCTFAVSIVGAPRT